MRDKITRSTSHVLDLTSYQENMATVLRAVMAMIPCGM
jgi:hypothetical protein